MAALTDEFVKRFQPTTHFRECSVLNDKRIKSMCVSTDGQLLAATTNHHSLDVYDCNRGILKSIVHLRKYGCGAVDFIDGNADCVLVSSAKNECAIRLLNIEKKTYEMVYAGHTKPVVSMSVHQSSQRFLSVGQDNTVRLWDTRVPRCVAAQEFDQTPLCAWHPNGEIFAVGIDSRQIRLFDVRGLGNGAFSYSDSNPDQHVDWTKLEFSHSGNSILVSTNGPKIRVIDSYFGKIQHLFLSMKTMSGVCVACPTNLIFDFLFQFLFSAFPIRSTKHTRHSIGCNIQSGRRIHFLRHHRWLFECVQHDWRRQNCRIKFKLSRSHSMHIVQSKVFADCNGRFAHIILVGASIETINYGLRYAFWCHSSNFFFFFFSVLSVKYYSKSINTKIKINFQRLEDDSIRNSHWFNILNSNGIDLQ